MNQNQNLVTLDQAKRLRKLGYTEYGLAYAFKFDEKYIFQKNNRNAQKNSRHNDRILVIPTVDEAIDWIRRKYNVVVSNTAHPFVEPISHKIQYAYTIKFCNKKLGWNFRELIGHTDWKHNCYVAKRAAITIALNYIEDKCYRKTN